MPNYKNLKDLISLLENVLSEETLDEKIMTKEQARRRKKRLAKKRAERKARQQAEKEQEKNKSKETENNETGTALIEYKQPTNTDEDLTETAKEIIKQINELLNTHKAELEQADKIWEQSGKDKACPQEAWDIYNNSVNKLKQGLQNILGTINQEQLTELDCLAIDTLLTPTNGYLEKVSQVVLGIKPNLTEDDFKAPSIEPEKEQSTALTLTTSTELTTTSTEITPSQNKEVAKQEPVDNRRNKRNLVTYDKFKTLNKGLVESLAALNRLTKGLQEAIGNGAKAVIAVLAHPTDLIGDKVWNFLTSPLANDIVKTLMYSNPITAMIFDGKLGSLGIADLFKGIHDKAKNGLKKLQQGNKKNPEDYTSKGLPKSLENKTLKELYNEFYGNKDLVDLINVSYNHPEVKMEDKANLQKLTTNIGKAFNTKSTDKVKSNFKKLLELCENICSYMNWIKPSQWKNLVTKYVVAKGNTKEEEKQIDKKVKQKQDEPEESKSELSDEAINKIADAIIKKQKGESYIITTKLNKLLEAAEA